MGMHEFYYRFKPIGIDFSDKKEIIKYNSYLTSFQCLEDQFERLNSAFLNATKERADIMINVLPCISGVAEIAVFHMIKHKIFSRTIKKNCFALCITKYDENDTLSLYFYETEYFDEVKQTFQNFIETKTIPDLSNWERHFIG